MDGGLPLWVAQGGPACFFAFLAFFPFWNFACTLFIRLHLQVYY